MLFVQEVLQPVLLHINNQPERNAFLIDERYYTYKDFGECISKIRLTLRQRQVRSSNVGLVINDDLETYASIFALWLEGMAYVPLHPGWPLERTMDIIDQVGIDLVLDSSKESRYSPDWVLNTAILEYSEDCLDIPDCIDEDQLAYILFTSGSTGKPKGVQISKRNVGAFVESFFQMGIDLTPEDRCLQCFDLSFDVSVQGYLVPLTRGACVYTVPYDQIKYVYASALIEDYQLTFAMMAPSMLRYLKPYFDEIDATSLRICILTAEACPLQLMQDWWQCAVNTDIYDMYGPTECTIYATGYKVLREGSKTHNGIISIGRPYKNVKISVISDGGGYVPVNQQGELCLAGDQLTPGYWNNEEKNRECFFEHDGERWYRTGDIVMQDEDGDLLYIGRKDSQAKIQGFRVELGEIEYHAREATGVNSVAFAFDNQEGLTQIALFIESAAADTAALTENLRAKMPSYMIPSRYLCQPTFPLNANGKVDKNQLRDILIQSIS